MSFKYDNINYNYDGKRAGTGAMEEEAFSLFGKDGEERPSADVGFFTAGIVRGSVPDREAAEVDHKLRGLREVLVDAS